MIQTVKITNYIFVDETVTFEPGGFLPANPKRGIYALLSLDDELAKDCRRNDLLRVGDGLEFRLTLRRDHYHYWSFTPAADSLRGLARFYQSVAARESLVVNERLRPTVFKLNDYEWWVGYDLDSLKATYLAVTGVTEEEAFDSPYALWPEELEAKRFAKDQYEEEENGQTFAQQLDYMCETDQEFPCFFATTEN